MRKLYTVLALVLLLSACTSSRSAQRVEQAPPARAEAEQPQSEDEAYAESMAREHADDTPEASGITELPADAPEGEQVEYATVGGQTVTGYFVQPQGPGPHPAVIVIQEWWGLNDNIRTMARKLASQGYAALAVDLYGGEVAQDPERARQLMQEAMQDHDALMDNLRQAHAFLDQREDVTNIGVIGWCLGGALALQTGLALGDELDAVVMYYGRVVTDPQALAALEAPLIGFFGEADEGIPVEGVRQFDAALTELGKEHQVHIYEGADHAFANPSGKAFQAEAANDAWQKTLAFFEEHLRES